MHIILTKLKPSWEINLLNGEYLKYLTLVVQMCRQTIWDIGTGQWCNNPSESLAWKIKVYMLCNILPTKQFYASKLNYVEKCCLVFCYPLISKMIKYEFHIHRSLKKNKMFVGTEVNEKLKGALSRNLSILPHYMYFLLVFFQLILG